MKICHNLKYCRSQLGLTQDQVAERLHITRQTVSNYETGRSQPDLDTLVRLAGLYQVPVETLLYGDRKERRAVLLRRAAWGVVAIYLALLLFCSLSLLVINLSLPLDEIRLSAELANLRLFLVNRIWYPISRLPAALLFYALIALTAIDHTIPTPRRMWVRLLLFLVLFTGAAAVTLPFTLTNGPGSAELWLLAFSGQTTGSLMLLIDLAIWGVRLGWRRRAAARSAPDGPESGIQA